MTLTEVLRSRLERALRLGPRTTGEARRAPTVQAVHLVWRYGVYWQVTLPLMLAFSALGLVCGAIDVVQGETRLGLTVVAVVGLLVLMAVASARYHRRVLVSRRGVAINNPLQKRFYRWRNVRGIEETGSLFWMFNHVYEITFTDGSKPRIFLGTESTAAIFAEARRRAETGRGKAVRPKPLPACGQR